MRVFLAGIMQGSFQDLTLHSQEYRTYFRDLLEANIPGVDVFDPFEGNSNSIHYTDEVGKKVFLTHNYLCREMDVILAFIPEASMGTAIEMWEGNQNGAVVVTVSPLSRNWAVKFLSDRIYSTAEELEKDVRSGEFQRFVEERRKIRQNSSYPH